MSTVLCLSVCREMGERRRKEKSEEWDKERERRLEGELFLRGLEGQWARDQKEEGAMEGLEKGEEHDQIGVLEQ